MLNCTLIGYNNVFIWLFLLGLLLSSDRILLLLL